MESARRSWEDFERILEGLRGSWGELGETRREWGASEGAKRASEGSWEGFKRSWGELGGFRKDLGGPWRELRGSWESHGEAWEAGRTSYVFKKAFIF